MIDIESTLEILIDRFDHNESIETEIFVFREYLNSLKEIPTEEKICTIIFEHVCCSCSVTKEQVRSRSNQGIIIFARHTIANYIYKYTTLGEKSVGKLINRDHVTVNYIKNKSIPSFYTSLRYKAPIKELDQYFKTRFKYVQAREFDSE